MIKKLFKINKKEGVQSRYVKGILQSPISGKVLKLTDVPDDTFARKILGDGIAIKPEKGVVCSPVDGEIVQVFLPSKHAVCLKSTDGLEILIHIGIDTVKLNGYGFKALVKEGDKVTCGQELIKFDLEKIKNEAKSTITPIIITNYDDVKGISILGEGNILIGNDLIKVEI